MTIYETVTNRILNQMSAGQVPWRKTWKTGLPKSLGTGKEYHLCRARHKRKNAVFQEMPNWAQNIRSNLRECRR